VNASLTYLALVEVNKLTLPVLEKERQALGYMPSLATGNVTLVFAWVSILTFYWNGIYFAGRVVRSHERHLMLAEGKHREEGEKAHKE